MPAPKVIDLNLSSLIFGYPHLWPPVDLLGFPEPQRSVLPVLDEGAPLQLIEGNAQLLLGVHHDGPYQAMGSWIGFPEISKNLTTSSSAATAIACPSPKSTR